MVVLTKVIVISVSLKLFLVWESLALNERVVPFEEIDCTINGGSSWYFLHKFTCSYQCIEKLISQWNEDSVETTSYQHKQDISVLLTQVYIYLQGTMESMKINKIAKHKLCTQVHEETETAQNKGNTTIVFLQCTSSTCRQ